MAIKTLVWSQESSRLVLSMFMLASRWHPFSTPSLLWPG